MAAKLSLQLWSVKDATAKDFIGTLEAVNEMGYDGVEFAGYGGLSAEELKKELDRIGLAVSGSHVSIDALREDIDGVIAYNKTIGNKYIICPGADIDTKEKCEALSKEFLAYNEKVRANGMVFGYHNHHKEFDEFDGRYAFDILLSGDDTMAYELDTYWSEYAGVDTLAYLEKLGSRCPLVHLKDMKIKEDGSKDSCPYGTGILDHKAIIGAAKKNNSEWFVIEWEADDMDCLEAVKISVENLKKLV